jgi:hypothetical protein
VQQLVAQDLLYRQRLLKGRARATRKDRDVARGRAMAATRDRTIECGRSPGLDLGREPLYLAGIGRAHLEPQLAGRQPFEHAVRPLDDLCRNRGRREAGDDHVATLGHRAW